MKLRSRALARLGAGAIGLVAAGTFAAPAFAGPTDADVSVSGASSKIAVGAAGKTFRIDVHNAGPGVATDTTVTIDWTGLKDTSVKVIPDLFKGCDVAGETATCVIGDIPAGATLPLPVLIERVGGEGDAGSLTVSVESSAVDPDPTNNTATIPVEVVPSGVDLLAVAFDVYAVSESGPMPVVPGETAPLFWLVANEGDQTAKGISYSISLPEHVTFVDDFESCAPSAGKRTLTCEQSEAVLEPGTAVFPEVDMLVRVSEDAPGPVTLTGGLLKGSAMGTLDPAVLRGQSVTGAPKGLEVKQTAELLKDVDEGDNDASFAVFVGAKGGTGGGDGDGSGGGSGDGDGDGGMLPVTGVQAGLIGG
ncbi:MAG TPA: hypothetical protein VHN18_14205, partial [Micromonosporaceae bacterium]|nr:hypothetical protein [Micromonosporaceae bacterium]